MIKIMTLDTGDQPGSSTDRLQECLAPLDNDRLDVLCCQSIRRSLDDREDTTQTLAHSLGLTYSCFAASRRSPKKRRRKHELNGLAILTGSEVWTLNSGSFPIPGEREGEEEIGQFALVRKNSTSVLVLNLQLSSFAPTQSQQLQSLFSFPMLKEHYGAVVLCSDRHTKLASKELRTITTRSNYVIDRSIAPASPGKGMLCLLTPREQPGITVAIGNTEGLRTTPSPRTTQAPQPGLSIEFEIRRIPQAKKLRRYLPLSYREHWLGYREKHPAFAA